MIKKWTPFAIIAIIGFLVYFRTLFFNFTYLDDNNLILDNQLFLSNLANIFKSFSIDVFHLFNNSAFYYRPLLNISFLFDYQLGGAFPFIYHLTNMVLHITASCLLFIFLIKLNYRKIISFIFSIIFLVHPVLTQAVAWIPGRNDSMLAVFVLLTFIFFIKYLKEEKGNNLLFSLIFFAASLFTKESGLLIVPILILYFYFIYEKREKNYLSTKHTFFIWSICIVIFWILLRHLVIGNSNPISFIGMIKSIWINFPAVIQFIGKIFLPFNLSVLPIMEDTTFIYGIISIILLLIIILFTKVKRWNYILFGVGWFFAFLLPSFIRPNTGLVADFIQHRLYVPIIGIFIILLETDFVNKINFKKKSVLVMVGILIFILSVTSIIFSGNFANRLAFWNNAVNNSPHYPLAHRNLGAMELLDGNMDNAEKEFKKALILNSNEQMVHNNLGLIYAERGQFVDAEIEYNKELEINPIYENAYLNLGLLYFQTGRNEEAIISWKKVLRINPDNIEALKYLTSYYYKEKNYQEAIMFAGKLYRMGLAIPTELLKVVKLSGY